jgi:hypothetical protein
MAHRARVWPFPVDPPLIVPIEGLKGWLRKNGVAYITGERTKERRFTFDVRGQRLPRPMRGRIDFIAFGGSPFISERKRWDEGEDIIAVNMAVLAYPFLMEEDQAREDLDLVRDILGDIAEFAHG